MQRNCLSWHWRAKQNLKKKLSCGLENDMRNLTDFYPNIWMSKLRLDEILLSKLENAWAKNLKSYVWWHWRMMKIWRAIALSFQNWHDEFDNFWPKYSKVSKTCTLIGSFWPNYIMFQLSFMTLKSDAKLEEKLTCGLENDIRNMFLPEHAKVSKLGLWWNFFIQSRNVWA